MSYLSQPVIIAGVVKAIHQGIATRSLPPQLHGKVELSNIEVLRGSVDGSVFQFIVEGQVDFQVNKPYVFFGCSREEIFAITGFTTDLVETVKQKLAGSPYGWNGSVSPFKKAFNHPELEAQLKPLNVCSVSKYPYYTLDKCVSYKVEKIIPPTATEFGNPYGDGEFTVTLENKGSKDVITPVLVGKKSGTVYAEQSLIFENEGKYFGIDDPIAEELQLAVIKPGQTIKATINSLKLINQGFEFPNGGSRVYFNFILGGQVSADFFYYYSSIHDAMVAKLK